MARRAHWGWWLAGILGILTLGTTSVAYARTHSTPPAQRAQLEAKARKWGPIFGVDPAWIMAIAKIESGWRPDTVNYSLRSIPLGGAWGPLQMTKVTADDWAGRLARDKNPEVRAAAARWRGRGVALTKDLDLAVLLSTAFLGRLVREFKTFTNVAAAYHQGAGRIRKMLAARQAIPAELPPKGKLYVSMALAARRAVG